MRRYISTIIGGSLFLLLFVIIAISGNVSAQQVDGGENAVGDEPDRRLTEAAFFASFESEPPGLLPGHFSMSLGGQQFDFIFTLEGDQYGARGFSFTPGFGEGDSGSINLQSAGFNTGTFERVIIVRNDGADFVIHSLFVNNRGGTMVTVAGKDNGVQVGAAQTVDSEASATLDFGGLVVDEVSLRAADFFDTHIDSFAGDSSAQKDYGDLPPGYALTTDANSGASHALSSLYLGNCVDADVDGQPSSGADGDDVDGAGGANGSCQVTNDDEDGVAPAAGWSDGVDGGSIDVAVSGGDGCLSGWIDWAGDGAFSEAGDHVVDMVAVTGGANSLTFDVPAGVFDGSGTDETFFARFRLVADTGATGDCADEPALTAGGPATGGEVEDYAWAFSPTAVRLRALSATRVGGVQGVFVVVAILLGASASIVLVAAGRRKQAI